MGRLVVDQIKPFSCEVDANALWYWMLTHPMTATMQSSIGPEVPLGGPTSGATHLSAVAVAALGHWIGGKALPQGGSNLNPGRLFLGQRLVVELSLHGGHQVLADGITGVLYDAQTGRCLSSSRLLLDVGGLAEVSKAQAQSWMRRRLAAQKASKK